MPKCDECQDTGACPCGATDCRSRCRVCYCDSCSEQGKKLTNPGAFRGTVCDECQAAFDLEQAKDAHDEDQNDTRLIERIQDREDYGFRD